MSRLIDNAKWNHEDYDLMVGYGTFITQFYDAQDGAICKVLDHKRVYQKNNGHGYWYPFALKSKGDRFFGVVFPIDKQRIPSRDRYESVYSGLYIRKKTKILVKDKDGKFTRELKAWIYTPGIKSIKIAEEWAEIEKYNDGVKEDSWLDEIRIKIPKLKKKFPEFWQNRFISAERLEEMRHKPIALMIKEWITLVERELCTTCGKKIEGFRNEKSKKEYTIGGMCQKCQDSVFGVD